MPKQKAQKKNSEIKLNNEFPSFPKLPTLNGRGWGAKGNNFMPSLRLPTVYSVIAKIDMYVSNH